MLSNFCSLQEANCSTTNIFQGPPPPNYICQYCSGVGHWKWYCPQRNKSPPPTNYVCEFCGVTGVHWKWNCPGGTSLNLQSLQGALPVLQKKKSILKYKLKNSAAARQEEEKQRTATATTVAKIESKI